MPPQLLLVGCGKMGGALAPRLAEDMTVTVVEPSPRADSLSRCVLAWHASAATLDAAFDPDIVLLAVKPQQMAAALPAYGRFRRSVFLSIAAGVTLARLADLLRAPGDPQDPAIVRAMPNLPASIGMGMTVAVANPAATDAQRRLCSHILEKTGAAAWIEDEDLMDAVTALSGSGPAYVFALCESMARAGEALGLPPELALRLARQTVIGSGALLGQLSASAAALRQAVASPGGTTEAALNRLSAGDGLDPLIAGAMRAAAERAKKLAQ